MTTFARLALAFLILFLIVEAGIAYAAGGSIADIARINWRFVNGDTSCRGELWVNPDGSLGHNSCLPGERSAFDLWPSSGGAATQHAITEMVFHRYFSEASQSRTNLSQMAGAWPQFRIASEIRGVGPHNDFVFAFDNEPGTVASEPFAVWGPQPCIHQPLNATNRLVVDAAVPAQGESGLWVFFRVGPAAENIIGRKVKCSDPDANGRRQLYIDP